MHVMSSEHLLWRLTPVGTPFRREQFGSGTLIDLRGQPIRLKLDVSPEPRIWTIIMCADQLHKVPQAALENLDFGFEHFVPALLISRRFSKVLLLFLLLASALAGRFAVLFQVHCSRGTRFDVLRLTPPAGSVRTRAAVVARALVSTFLRS